MAGLTSIYGLPYQSLTDPPHGPQLGQDLAQAVEDELARVDAAAAAGVGVVGGKQWTATTGGNFLAGLGSGSGELTVYDSGAVSLKAGRRYRISTWVDWNATAADVVMELQIRDGTLTGAQRGYRVPTKAVGSTPTQSLVEATYEPTVDVTTTFLLTAKVITAGLTVTFPRSAFANNPTRFEIHNVGQAGRLTAV